MTLRSPERVLIVNFDPATNATQLAAFKQRYGISNPSQRILGPYSGKLANNSDRIALERPQAPEMPGGEISWVVVDEEMGSAELALSVLDGWQGSGVANRLMETLMAGARRAGLRHIYGDVLDANLRMMAFMRKHGLERGFDEPPDRGVERVSCVLP